MDEVIHGYKIGVNVTPDNRVEIVISGNSGTIDNIVLIMSKNDAQQHCERLNQAIAVINDRERLTITIGGKNYIFTGNDSIPK